MAAAILVSGPALRSLLQLVDQTDGAAGEGLEAHGDDGESCQTQNCHPPQFTELTNTHITDLCSKSLYFLPQF